MDYLLSKYLPIYHLPNHFHTNTDTYLLFKFASIKHNDRVIDLGCNNGALMILASLYQPKVIHGIDIVDASVDIANKNLALNKVEQGVCWKADISSFKSQEKYTKILCNPPYFQMIDTSNPFDNARHQHLLTIDDVMRCIHGLLENKGRAYLIYPTNHLAKLIESANHHRLKVSRLQLYQHHLHKASNVVCVELTLGVSNDVSKIEPVLLNEDLLHWKEKMNIFIEERRSNYESSSNNEC